MLSTIGMHTCIKFKLVILNLATSKITKLKTLLTFPTIQNLVATVLEYSRGNTQICDSQYMLATGFAAVTLAQD